MRSFILRLLSLVAVLILPLGMAAAPAATHHAEMGMSMPMSHCADEHSKGGSKGLLAECTMACSAALPAVDLAPLKIVPLSRSASQPSATATLSGIELEIATPPPRLS
jgi:hypothetical protein